MLIKMWNTFRPCGIHLPIIFIVILFTLSIYLVYNERSSKENVEETLQNVMKLMKEQSDLIEQLYDINKHSDRIFYKKLQSNQPLIFVITPTFARPVQKAELTRLAQTFMHISNFFWIVVEDSPIRTKLVTNLLLESGMNYQHLNVLTPVNFKLKNNDPHWKKPRGAAQRNEGLAWIRNNVNNTVNGVVYFADDDNTYSIKLFKEIEKIKGVGVWPVGLVGGLMVEKPICDNRTKKVVGFNAAWKPDRPFPIDMAGFAVNLKLILENKDAWFSYEARNGYQESEILKQMVTREQLEPLADFCTKVYVWHTRTEPPVLREEQKLNKQGKHSDDNIEV